MAEGDDVAGVTDEAHSEDVFTATHVTHLAYLEQLVSVAGQHRHQRLALILEPPWATECARHPQVAAVFGHGELVKEVAGNRARGSVGSRGRFSHVELVD